MDPAVILIIVIAIIAVFGFWYWQRQRTASLRDGFGDEYDRAVHDKGSLNKAERELEDRQTRVKKYDIRPLTDEQQQQYRATWHDVQALFVDEPVTATEKAEALITDVMDRRGYPTTDFEHQAADLSVNHPTVVEHYRKGHEISERHRAGNASTEDMRQAMVHYRTLFERLVDPDTQDEEQVDDGGPRVDATPTSTAAGTATATTTQAGTTRPA
jgi:FtsZ-interacting cell division protein ZipA